jgi:glycosyltransferase involved in cell wall biosynthesis
MTTEHVDYSLVMATKNGEKLIAETLKSVLQQSLPPAQVIVVIDHATDRTVEVAKSVIPSAEIYYSEGHGMTPALNLGIGKATSTYISFLDHDDLWVADKQARQVEYLNQHSGIDVVCAGTRNFSVKTIDGKEIETHKDFPASRLFSASTFRRDVFDRVGLIDETEGHFQWIYQWWSEAGNKGIKYASLDEVHLLRRIHETNSWVSHKETAHQQLLEAVRRHKNREA